MSWGRHLLPALGPALLILGCATLKAPILQVEGLKMGKVGITGAAMEVAFRVRNPNPDPMLIERFDYELFVNGHRLGRGFQPDAVELPGFKDERVVSRFDINFLSLPGAVKAVLDDDRAAAKVKGHFYVRQGGGLKKLGFAADAEVDIKK
jgi:LEA14-like dessication related protein